MKAIRTICLLLCSGIILSSCDNIKTIELSERLIIEAIGVDVKDGEVSITLLALDTEKGNSENSSETQEQTKIYNFSADTVGKALAKAKASGGHIPLYSHARVLLIGSTGAKEQLNEILDFFLREYTTRSDILIALAPNEAKEVLSADLGGNSNGKLIENTIEAGGENGKNTVVPLYKFVNLMLSETDTAYCPVVEIIDSREEKRKDLVLEKTAFFDKNRLLFTLSSDITRGLLLLSGEARNQSIAVEEGNNEITLNTVKCKTKIKPSVKDGKAHFLIETEIIADMTEYVSDTLNEISISDIESTKKLLSEKVKEYEERVLSELFREKGCDVCRFSRIILQKHPDFYNRYVSDISALTDYTVNVKATVRRSGRERLKDIT